MVYDRDSFEVFLISNDCVELKDPPVHLNSGRTSPYKIELEKLLKNFYVAQEAANFVYQFIQSKHPRFDMILGVPYGAAVIGSFVNQIHAHATGPEKVSASILRKTPRENDRTRDRYFVGNAPPQGTKVLLLEDTITTGGETGRRLKMLNEIDLLIDDVGVLAHRKERSIGGKTPEEMLKRKYDVNLHSMTDVTTLLPKFLDSTQTKENDIRKLEAYLNMYCTEEIKLIH